MPDGLPCSAARVAGENGPSVRRAFGHAASPRRGTRRPGFPVSRARRSPATPPDCTLVCFGQRPKRSRRSIRLPRPVGPFACSGRAILPSKHTHMSAEAYPPDGPQISPRQGSQNFSARPAGVKRAVQWSMTRLSWAMRPENFCARHAGGCAVPDPDSFGNQAFGHATTLTWWFPEHLETPT